MQCLQHYLETAMSVAAEIYSASTSSIDFESVDETSAENTLVSYADDV